MHTQEESGARFDPASADLDIGSVPTREDLERIKARSACAQARMDDVLGSWSSVLDRPDGPAPAPDPITEWIEEARSALAAARSTAERAGDPRLQGITASLMHLEEL